MEVTDGVREGSLKVIFQSVSPRPPSLARSQSKARATTKQARLYQSPITHTTTTTTSLHYTTTLPSSSSSLHWPRRGSLTDGRGWGCHSRSVTHPRHRREKPAIGEKSPPSRYLGGLRRAKSVSWQMAPR